MRSLLMLTLFALSLDFTGFSQGESVINYTTKDGLPSSQVYDIIQDDYGYLWFSTDKGLSRYDGYEFQNFNKSDGLTDDVVFDLIKRPNGEIWGTTNSSALFYFEGANPRFTPYKYNNLIKKYGANKIIHSLYISDSEDLYLSFHDHLNYLKFSNSGKVQNQPFRYTTDAPIHNSTSIYSVLDDDNDPFYFATDSLNSEVEVGDNRLRTISVKWLGINGTRRFEAMCFENKATSVFIYNNSIHLVRKQGDVIIDGAKDIIASGKLNDTQFWVGFRYGGVRVYNLDGEKINEFLTDQSVTQLFVDHEGHSWISTLEHGVFMIRNKSMNFLSDIGVRRINTLSKGPNNDLYFGGYDGKIFNRTADGNLSLFFESNLNYQPVHIAYDEPRKQIYFSSGLIFDLDRTIYENTHVDYISLVGDRCIASGTFGVRLFDCNTNKKKKLFGKIRTKDVVSYEGAIYAASIFGLYKSSKDDDIGAAKLVIDKIRIDDLEIFGKYLALGTNGDGLIIMSKYHKPVFSIKQKDGITSNYITKAYAENDSTLWICTNKGVNRIVFNFKTKDYKIEKLGVTKGLVSNEVWDLLINNDTIWIGTQGGVNFISKKDFSNLDTESYPYFLQWKSMRVNDQLFDKVHAFDYDQNKLEFRLLGISFEAESNLIYQYKLLGLDKNWSFTKNREITFSSLPPGSYELIVRVKSKNKTLDKNEIRYAFKIHPPFWKTAWFFLLCVIAIGALVYLFFKIRVFTYNKDVVREIMRYILQKLRRDEPTITVRVNGKDLRIKTGEIHYIKTSGNYLEINLKDKSHLVRSSIAKFIETVPDKIEFIQIHRSYIVRIDKVQQKGKDQLIVLDTTIPIGRMYTEQLKLIEL